MEASNSWSWEKAECEVADWFLSCYFFHSSSDSEMLAKDLPGGGG